MQSLVLVLAAALASDTAADLMGPDAIERAVAVRGAREVVNAIWSDERACRALLAGVATAEPDWVRVAAVIQPGTDAGASEELDDALAEALLVSPSTVLPVVGHIWWERSSFAPCEFDWDSELPGGVTPYVTRLEAALGRDSALPQLLRTACETGIEKTRQRVRRHDSGTPAAQEDGL